MCLDGHMILTTKGNEFFQAWLTFSEDDQIHNDSGEIMYDPIRSCQTVENTLKFRKKKFFKSPTIDSEYSKLLKIGKILIKKRI